MEQRIKLIYDSFYSIEKEMKAAIEDGNIEFIRYQLLRSSRLLAKMEVLIETNVQKKEYMFLSDCFQCRGYMKRVTSKWYEHLAYLYDQQRLDEQCEREWFASITESDDEAERFLQYAHASLRVHNLYVNKEIEETIEKITKTNIKDITLCIKRVRLTINASVSVQGATEQSSYILAWLDKLEEAINGREDLKLARETESEVVSLEKAIADLERLIGLNEAKRKIREITNWVTFNELRREQGFKTEEISLHMIFSGNPGTGKTTVARLVATILKAIGVLSKGHLVEVGRSDLVAEYVGQTAVKTMNKVKEAKGGVLFIDEAYSLVRSQSGGDFGIEAIDTLVKAMEDERKNMVVILAGYPLEMKQFVQSNPGLQSRFKNQIEFDDYSITELMGITDLLLKEQEFKMTKEAKEIFQSIITDEVDKNPFTHGNGRLVRNFVEDAVMSKAAHVMLLKERGLPLGELDLLDEAILQMVKVNVKGIKQTQSQGMRVDHDR